MALRSTKKLSEFFQKLKERKTNPLIITDDCIMKFYGELLLEFSIPIFLVPRKDAAKTRGTKEKIEDYLLLNKFGRDTELIGMGGGSISDLTGFVAATYMRGVTFSLIPTTVIAYVDASIGGKNGINTPFGKNLLGTFYDPVDTLYEKMFLETLPPMEYKEQLSEVFKIALLCDKDLFFSMENPLDRAMELKKEIVLRDKKEKEERKQLNLGHTFAHAYEASMNYKVSHGRAVLLGIYFASFLSYRLGVLKKASWLLIKDRLLEHFPQIDFSLIDPEKLYNLMKSDKKNKKDGVYFVLIKEIGEVYWVNGKVCHRVEKQIVFETLNMLKSKNICIVQ